MKQFCQKYSRSVLAYILVFSLILPCLTYITPQVSATAAKEETESAEITATTAAEENTARDLETLKKSKNVIFSSDGKAITGVKQTKEEPFTEEELNILLGVQDMHKYSSQEIKVMQVNGLKKRFGLSEEQIDNGKNLHGSMNLFQNELDSFEASKDNCSLSTEMQNDILTLIEHGYTNSQAFAAYVASGVLGVSVNKLAQIMADEIEDEQKENAKLNTAFMIQDNTEKVAEEQNEDHLKLSIKMGVPYSVIESFMKTSKKSIETLEEEFDAAKKSTYQLQSNIQAIKTGLIAGNPIKAHAMKTTNAEKRFSAIKKMLLTDSFPNIQSEPSIIAFDSDSNYYPEEILEKPFTYESDGNADINLNTGDYSYSETDLSIPGVNGLDLNIVRRFDSKYATDSTPVANITDDHENDIVFRIGMKPYLVGNSTDELEEISDLSLYSFPYFTPGVDSAQDFFEIDFELYYNNPNFCQYFEAATIDVLYGYYASLSDLYCIAYDQSNNQVLITFKRFVEGIEPYFSVACHNAAVPYNYYVDEFGMGEGWSLGFSAVETYLIGMENSASKRLITADGKKHKIKQPSHCSSTGSNLEDYDLDNIRFEYSGNGYPGASYTVIYKDGKREYFDSNGRNIAIVDRYGNAITLVYTITSSGAVSQIRITDTLGHNIVYADSNVDPSITQYAGGINNYYYRYNCKWTLTLDGNLIREYYSYIYNGVRYLTVVGNENNEYTRYNCSAPSELFNCFIPTASSNDGTHKRVMVWNIFYPNGLKKGFSTGTDTVERLGYSGYEQHHAVRLSEFTYDDNGYDVCPDYKTYDYGDYSGITTAALGEYHYSTTVTEWMSKHSSDVSCAFQIDETDYKFNQDHLKTEENQYNYTPVQYDLITSQNLYSLFDSLDSYLTKHITYSYNNNYGLPSAVNNTYYNFGSTTAGMTENYSYTYDSKGNVLTETKPNNQTITSTYDSNYSVPLTQSYNEDASTVILMENDLTSDGKNIAMSTTKENGVIKAKIEYSYDATGKLTGEKDYIDPTNYAEKQYVYGNNAQITESKVIGVKDLDGNPIIGTAGYSTGTVVTKATYNTRGWPISQTDAEGNETELTYDNIGRIIGVTNPDGSTAGYAYDVANNTVTYTDELGNVLRYTYNEPGSLLEVYDVTGSQTLSTKAYDSMNRLIGETLCSSGGENKTTYYYYDTQNRVIETGTLDENDILTSQVAYAYLDGTGKVTKTVTGDSNAPSMVTTEYKDNVGNVTARGKMYGGTEYQDTYTYDYVGNVITEKTAYTDSIGGTCTNSYTYDHAGRVLSTTDALGHTSYTAYDWLGNPITTADNSGNITLYTYDALGRLLQKQQPFTTVNSTVCYGDTQYQYDLNGNITTQKIANSEPGASLTYSQTNYAYDNRNQLIMVTTYDNEAPENYTQYYYDSKGNTLRMYTGLSSPLTISGLDSVNGADTDYSITKYTYDRFSNMISTIDPLDQLAASREVRNLGTPGGELGCV